MEIDVIFSDGRPALRYESAAAASEEPYAWDGRVRTEATKGRPGYPPPESRSMGSLLTVRVDGAGAVVLDTAWANTVVGADTPDRAYRADGGPAEWEALVEAGRSIELVAPKDARAVLSVSASAAGGAQTLMAREWGALCLTGAMAAAAQALEPLGGEAFKALFGLSPSDAGAGQPGGQAALAALARCALPSLEDGEAEADAGRPCWDDGALSLLCGAPQEAIWRASLRERFLRGGLFEQLPGPSGGEPPLADLLTVWPAAAWYREAVRAVGEGPAMPRWPGGGSGEPEPRLEAEPWVALPPGGPGGGLALSWDEEERAWRAAAPGGSGALWVPRDQALAKAGARAPRRALGRAFAEEADTPRAAMAYFGLPEVTPSGERLSKVFEEAWGGRPGVPCADAWRAAVKSALRAARYAGEG